MYRYLTDKTADYTAVVFEVKPTTTIPQTGDKTQVVHEFDDGSVSVIGVSSSNFFNVVLQWRSISDADQTTLIDFWHNEAKGAGRRRTFYWLHPIDGHTYTVRFMTVLSTSYDGLGNLSISQITLRVEGNKP